MTTIMYTGESILAGNVFTGGAKVVLYSLLNHGKLQITPWGNNQRIKRLSFGTKKVLFDNNLLD
jgi:hypothetical protein